jgi:hypothetical protein
MLHISNVQSHFVLLVPGSGWVLGSGSSGLSLLFVVNRIEQKSL